MKNLLPKNFDWTIAGAVLVGLGFFGMILYVNYRHGELEEVKQRISILEGKTERAESMAKELSSLFFNTLSEDEKRNAELMEQFEQVTDSVQELEKLSETDPELLQKYSKVYFLNEHYVPISLSDVGEEFRSSSSTNYQIHSDVLPFLEDLLEEAKDDGLSLLIQSAYRSFGTQSTLKANYTVTYGSTAANRFSADQGYSEHQLGTTIDFTTLNSKGSLEGFDKTPEYQWLLDNAYKFGFIISYPAGNTYYKFEPWHWRFVGVDLARRLHRDGINFYDADQRLIDSYLSRIFD